MAANAVFIYTEDFLKYDFGPSHPLRPDRLRLTYELIDSYGLFDLAESRLEKPPPAGLEDLKAIHSEEYIEVVQRLSRGDYKHINPARFGFGLIDNPIFEGMYEASCMYTGASISGANLVVAGEVPCAFNISGGLHHAGRDFAHGFCIFNDPAIIISQLIKKGQRVVYIDIDVHHGDGVQNAFYDSSQVLTISIHESGRFLFPGTGEIYEMGSGEGKGYSLNVPLAPYTNDEIYLQTFNAIVPPLVESFQPDIVVSQLGVDSHYLDPLAHFNLTIDGYGEVVKSIKKLASGKWVALGGGGYRLEVVPRGWCLAYSVMLEVELPNEIPDKYSVKYGIKFLRDKDKPVISSEQHEYAKRFADRTVAEIKSSIFPRHQLI